MEGIKEIAERFNVSEESLKLMISGVNRRVQSLPLTVKERMLREPAFADEVYRQAVISWRDSSMAFFDRYFSDDEYRKQVISEVYDQIKKESK